ncbi:MAG: PEP-CTERM sorting domain-containing protein [Nitrosomonas sp. PRO4]|nr:PEP-CTERM sorting domain-containing protein [Nitrosomonas sp. PRO4]
MKKSFKLKLVAAAILMTSGVAHAAPTQAPVNWFNHDPAEFAVFHSAVGHTFEHEYLFSLGSSVNALATAVTNDFANIFNIAGGKVELFKSNGDNDFTNDTSIGSFAFDSTATGGIFNALTSGDYYYQVTGSVVGNYGGGYQMFSNVSPVPEPETYAMLLAGLGLIGFSLRRRQAL